MQQMFSIFPGSTSAAATEATLTQSGNTLTGLVVVPLFGSSMNARIEGTLDSQTVPANITGTMRVETPGYPNTGGPRCSGTAAMTGTVSAAAILLKAAVIQLNAAPARCDLTVREVFITMRRGSMPTDPVANVTGTWRGSFGYTSPDTNARSTETLTMTLAQSGSAVTGTWSTAVTPPRTGNVTGTMAFSSFTGSFSYRRMLTGGVTCTGAMAVVGSVNTVASAIAWESRGLSENCSNAPLNISFTATRQ